MGKDPGPLPVSSFACYLCQRLSEDADLYYLCGHGTEICRRLCLAVAEETGRPLDEIEAEVRAIRHARPRLLFASDQERAEHHRHRAAKGDG